MPYVTHVITDLASLAAEIDGWREDLASSRGQYADIWRKVFHIAEQQPRPGVTWCPAHKDAHHYLFSSGRHDVNDSCGNAWADFFAKIGAQGHVLPSALHDLCRIKMSDAKEEARLFAWLMAAIGTTMDDTRGLVPKRMRPSAPTAPVQLVQQRHQLVRKHASWQCAFCLASASSEAAWRRVERTECAPSALQKLMARARARLPYSTSSSSSSAAAAAAPLPTARADAIAIALRAADRVLGPEAGVQGQSTGSFFLSEVPSEPQVPTVSSGADSSIR